MLRHRLEELIILKKACDALESQFKEAKDALDAAVYCYSAEGANLSEAMGFSEPKTFFLDGYLVRVHPGITTVEKVETL